MEEKIKKRIRKALSKDYIRAGLSTDTRFVSKDEYADHVLRRVLSTLDVNEIAIAYIDDGILKVDCISDKEV